MTEDCFNESNIQQSESQGTPVVQLATNMGASDDEHENDADQGDDMDLDKELTYI